ncbi:MAG: hypothetical protein HY248_04765 [Fimbriimonas ginsengisoli]|nr:hypothetical protein [Fimbriimonas ginsengisoli]
MPDEAIRCPSCGKSLGRRPSFGQVAGYILLALFCGGPLGCLASCFVVLSQSGRPLEDGIDDRGTVIVWASTILVPILFFWWLLARSRRR